MAPSRLTWVSILAVVLAGLLSVAAQAQSTGPATEAAAPSSEAAGPLRIHITAVQGVGQYRETADAHWQTAKANMDLPEGVELRTGAHGVIQFTIGTDQIMRLDRLSVLKVLRANLLPDGTIRTDVGMTYGRVAKDVDEPAHPHQDTIVTPSSTLAVRGTRVSMWDSPPYDPIATSLTGNALITSKLKGQPRSFGKKGEGKAAIQGDDPNAAQSQINSQTIYPTGAFSGQTPAETAIAALFPGQTPPGIFQNLTNLTTASARASTSGIGSTGIGGEILFDFIWASPTVPSTQVTFNITSPLGEMLSSSNPTATAPSGGAYGSGSSPIAAATAAPTFFSYTGFAGNQYFIWGDFTNPSGTYPPGTYKITATLNTTSSDGGPVTIDTAFFVSQENAGGESGAGSGTVMHQLSASSPTITYTVPAPISNNQTITTNPPSSGSSGSGTNSSPMTFAAFAAKKPK